MSILDSELQMFKSETINDLSANGGLLDNNAPVSTGVVNNVWPSVFKAERLAGSKKYRKTFLKVENDDDLVLYYPMIWLDIVTPGDDWVTFFSGTQIDTQGADGSHTGAAAATHYGCAALKTNVAAAASSFTVTVEDVSLITGGADEIFRAGDTIRITDKTDPTSGTGNEEIHTISGTPTNSGNDVTITITGTLDYAYTTAANARVMTVYEPSDVVSLWDSWVETSTSGTYDEGTTGNVVADNIGSIEEEYEVKFTDATNFTVRDFADNVIGSWTTSQDAIPLNPDNSKPLFTLLAAGWGGTWAADETIVFETHPATVPIWQQRVVPAAADSLAGDRTTVAITGESV